MYYTYLLKSKKANQIYIGSTNNLRRRFQDHNSGKEISTKRYMPWKLLYYEAYLTEILARLREKRLKHNGNALRELKKRLGIFSGKSGAGFTLIEVLIATFVIIVGVVGITAVIQQTITYTALSSSRLVASYLTQEGIEIVRNIRDRNWLEGRDWTEGLSGCGECCEADYNDQSLALCTQHLRFLKIDDDGFYNYESVNDTKFKRKITITSGSDSTLGFDVFPYLKVQVQVQWQQIGKTHQFEAQEYLYKWWQE